ncbi:HTH-type transcriptional regulator BhcR [Paracoccus albus]|uniref:HTH-type transcriptional regulator BhcR n=1 Tax=Paracoccus albus TaxID=3017784 RepID=UPI0022F10CC5|nr:HTH-type transcriptional regulator BhcR [Paracoccus albus]WBU58847.1 IclR family transcriptional regulator [Paracoccus albus]
MDPQDNDKEPDRKARGRPRGWHDVTDQNTIKSLDRAMEVFEFLSENSGCTLTAIANELGQSPATVYRILVTLSARDLVEFDAAEQLWHIGPRAFVVGSRFLRRTSLVERARPILRQLMETTGETANLGIEREGSVLFVSQVETHASIRAFFPPGTMSPMHASGIGKALLANMPNERASRHLQSVSRQSFTEKTIIDPSRMAEELSVILLRGYSVDDEERNTGMRCVAAPVFDIHREAAAGISVSGPTSRITSDKIEELGRCVAAAARELTLAIGGEPLG